MSFDTGSNSGTNNGGNTTRNSVFGRNRNQGNQGQGQQDDSWKAAGFLNFYAPANNEAGRRKVGAIPLRDQTKPEAELVAWLKKDPANAVTLAKHLIVEFNAADASEGTSFLIPGMGGSDIKGESDNVDNPLS